VKKETESGRYRVILASCPNPDFDEKKAKAPAQAIDGNTLDELRQAAREYQKKYDLGGGNWAGGAVVDNKTGKLMGHFSYNLRFWDGPISDPNGKEIFDLP
jgi:ABC-type glycerol-3-phosphate transport system substrate-binding protein